MGCGFELDMAGSFDAGLVVVVWSVPPRTIELGGVVEWEYAAVQRERMLSEPVSYCFRRLTVKVPLP
jgi:hypothetical protein